MLLLGFATKQAPQAPEASPVVFPAPRPSAFCVSVCFPAMVPDVFVTKSTRHRRQNGQKKSCPRTVARGARGLSQIWLEFRDKRKTKISNSAVDWRRYKNPCSKYGEFHFFFPSKCSDFAHFFSKQICWTVRSPPFFRHKFVTQKNPWLGSIFLVRNFTKIQKKRRIFVSIFSIFPLKTGSILGK